MSLDVLDTVKIGIAGPSWWVNYWHLPALQNYPDAEIVAVSGDKERDPAEVREKYGDKARYFTSYEEMMDSVYLDGVIVCTPNDLHYPITMAALRRNLHVNCEKPLALNAEQAFEMYAMAEERGLLGLTNFPYRDNPNVEAFRRLMEEGYVGTPLHVSGSYHGGFGLGRNPNWRSLRERSGAGILGDLGSHLIDLVRYITDGTFASVCAHSLTTLWDEEKRLILPLLRSEDPAVGVRNDDSCMFAAEFDTGMQGLFHTSWVAYQGKGIQEQIVEVYGTEGRLRFEATHWGNELRGLKRDKGHWETIEVPGVVLPSEGEGDSEDYFRPGRLGTTNTTYRWLKAIRGEARTITPDFYDGWQAQAVIDAVIKSSAERRWVEVFEEDEIEFEELESAEE